MTTSRRSLLLMVSILLAWPVGAVTVTVDSLFPAAALTVDRLLPFRLNVTGLKAGDVTSAEVENVAREICRAQQDPFRPNFILLKCKQPRSGLYLTVEYLDGQVRKAVRIGPLTIAKLPSTLPTPTPTPTPAPGSGGAALYTSNCASCHSAVWLKSKSPTLGKVRNMILTVPQMGPLSSLSDAQINAIITYVNSQ